MTTKPENPPAFPVDWGSYGIEPTPGMTLRDWFAGQALMGFISSNETIWSSSVYASAAYEIADSMLSARAKQG